MIDSQMNHYTIISMISKIMPGVKVFFGVSRRFINALSVAEIYITGNNYTNELKSRLIIQKPMYETILRNSDDFS